MNETQLTEKRYRDKLEEDKKENTLNNESMKNKIGKLKKQKKTIISVMISYKKQNRQQIYKRKNNMK